MTGGASVLQKPAGRAGARTRPGARPRAHVLSPAGRWAFVAGVEIGDIVVINRRPLGQPAISVRCVVLQVETSFKFGDQTSADVTLTLAVAPPRVAVCGDSSLGQLADTVLGV